MHVAALLGDHRMLRMLLQEGADLHQKTSTGRTVKDLWREGLKLLVEDGEAWSHGTFESAPRWCRSRTSSSQGS